MLAERGKSLRQVRESRRFDVADVARAATIKADRLEAFESGDAVPTAKQLVTLAALYGVPAYQLRPGYLPNTPPLPVDFRRRLEGPAKLSVNGFKAVLFGQKITSFISSIENCAGSGLKTRSISLPHYQRAIDLSDAFRSTISFDAEDFLNNKSPAKAFRFLRGSIELSGVPVLTTWYDHNDFRGYYLRHSGVTPSIMLHTRGWDLKSRLFTLAHEIAHYLLDREGMSDPFFSRNATEKYCNTFAATLLGPEEAIVRALRRTAYPRSDLAGFIRNVAAKTLLSQHATALRLVELGELGVRDFARWKSERGGFGDPKTGYSADGDPPDQAEQVLPRYGYLTALALEQAADRSLASPEEIYLATGIKPGLQRPLVEEAKGQLSGSAGDK